MPAVTAVKSGGFTFSFVLYIDDLLTQSKQKRYVLEEAQILIELLSRMFTVLKEDRSLAFFVRYFVLKIEKFLFSKPWQVIQI